MSEDVGAVESSGVEDGAVEGAEETSEGQGPAVQNGKGRDPSSGKFTAGNASPKSSGVARVSENDAKQAVKDVQSGEIEAEDLPQDMLDRRVTIKVNGEEKRMTVRDALKVQQLEQASRQKIQQASAMEAKVKQLLQRLDDPREYFKLRGIDPTEFAESTLKQQLEMLQETPEQRELRELREEKAARAKAEKEQLEAQEREKMTREEREAQAKYNDEFTKAWQKTGLPPNRVYGQMLAAEMVSANSRGEQLNWDEAAVIVKEKVENLFSERVKQMDAEAILKLIGKDKEEKIRHLFVDRISNRTAPTANSGSRPVQPNGPASASRNPKPKIANESQWDAWLREK